MPAQIDTAKSASRTLPSLLEEDVGPSWTAKKHIGSDRS